LAEYPCDFHLARYSGPSTRCFLNLYRDDQAVFLRASVCGDCLADVVSGWLERALYKTSEGQWDPTQPNQELDGLWQAQEWPASQRNGSRRYR
jgi:hypothetical protein